MRILTYTSLFPNSQRPVQGIFVYQRIAHVLKRPGNNVRVISPVPYFPAWFPWTRWKRDGQIPREERIADLTVYHPRYPLLPKISMPFQGLLMFLGSLHLALRLHSEKPFDCIDAHFVFPDGFAAILLGKFLKVPVIVSARGTDINLYPTFKLIRPMIRWTLKHSAGLIAVSAALRKIMYELGASPDRVRVIGNGIDSKRFHPIDAKEAKRRLGLPENGQTIVSVGALIPAKGFHFLISAVAQITSQFPDLRLYILGEGDYRSKLERLIRECGVEGKVRLVGSVPNEELRFWFSAANVSCLVSSREGWANVLQESLACGTPVVATDVWGTPEVVISTELGLLVEQDTQAIGAALREALTKEWNRAAISRHASERTWEVVAIEVEEFLSLSVIKSKDGGERVSVGT